MIKNPNKECQNPNCDNKTNSKHSMFCSKCSIRHHAKSNGYKLDEIKEIDLGDQVGYVLVREDLVR